MTSKMFAVLFSKNTSLLKNIKLMKNSVLNVFLNVQPILTWNNLPFDQTNNEFYLLLMYKKGILNFVLYLLKSYLFSNILWRSKVVYSIYIWHFYRRAYIHIFIYSYIFWFIKELFFLFFHFQNVLKTEKQMSLYLFELLILVLIFVVLFKFVTKLSSKPG